MDVRGSTARVQIDAGLRVPPGGIEVRSPIDGPVKAATVDGQPTSTPVVLRQLPAEVVFQH